MYIFPFAITRNEKVNSLSLLSQHRCHIGIKNIKIHCTLHKPKRWKSYSQSLVCTFNHFLQVRLHPWCLHPDHRVRLTDRHPGGDAKKVPQPHLLHHVLSKPLHYLALVGYSCGLPGHSVVHRGVEQRAGGSAWTRRQGEEGRVKEEGELEQQPLCWT